jgi:hypothetical protein
MNDLDWALEAPTTAEKKAWIRFRMEQLEQERDEARRLYQRHAVEVLEARAKVERQEAALRDHWDHDDTWCFACHSPLPECSALAALGDNEGGGRQVVTDR